MITKELMEDYNNSFKLFLALRLELENVIKAINSYEELTSFESKKVGIFKYVKKLQVCFDALRMVSSLNSVQSLVTLLRMILDNYAILYLLTNHSNKEEQLLRYYLFLLDATRSRPSILGNFSSNIKFHVPEDAYENTFKAISSDKQSSNNLLRLIEKYNLNKLVSKEIIENANWKFKDARSIKQKNNKYNWIELYKIARIPDHHAEMYQNYYSAHVHGLAMSLMADTDEGIVIFTIQAFYTCSIIISLIIKIVTLEYEKEMKDFNLHPRTIEFMNSSWTKWK